LNENAIASKKGGAIAKDARLALEAKTGKAVVTGENFLPASKKATQITAKTKKMIGIYFIIVVIPFLTTVQHNCCIS
jgi:hypothetical protein